MHARAPILASENATAIAGLSQRIDALQNFVNNCTALADKVTTIENQMSGLLQWQTSTDARLNSLEQWRHDASPAPYVTQSRFDQWVSDIFTPAQQRAAQAVPQSAFDQFGTEKFKPAEKQALEATPRSQFSAYVTRMAQVGYTPPAEDAAMNPAHLTGPIQDRLDEPVNDIGSPSQSAKERAAKQANTPSGAGPSRSTFVASSSSSLLPTLGAQTFNSVPAPSASWLCMPPTPESQWSEDALELLFGEWSAHMDSRLQQWATKHAQREMKSTVDSLVRTPWIGGRAL